MMVLSSVFRMVSDAMAVLSAKLVRSSVSIQTATHSVIGVRRAHLLGHKPAQHLEQMTSATLVKPASRCTVNVSIPVIPIRPVHRAFVM